MSTPETDAHAGQQLGINKSWLELLVALVLLSASLHYVHQTLSLPSPLNTADVGPATFPLILGGGMTLALVLWLIATSGRLRARPHGDDCVTFMRPLSVLAGAITVFVAVGVIETLGTAITLYMTSLLLMLAAGERRPLRLVMTPLLTLMAIYLLFSVILHIHLP